MRSKPRMSWVLPLQAQAASGPLLEIGCGTGRVTIPLAAAGVDITGLDVSASMLEEAKRKAESQGLHIKWMEADGRNFDLDRRFALSGHSRARSTFSLRHEAPRGGGRFVFDVFNPQVSFLAADPSARY